MDDVSATRTNPKLDLLLQNLPNFSIQLSGKISKAILSTTNIRTFHEACIYISSLPYKRNSNKTNPVCVLDEKCGTCGTKHALLKSIALENNCPQIQLMMGVFYMNGQNTPAIQPILTKYNLPCLPEAHNYLKVEPETVYDFTLAKINALNFKPYLLTEIEITPIQTKTFKIAFHKNFLAEWLTQHPEVSYNIENLWEIREKCIRAIAAC